MTPVQLRTARELLGLSRDRLAALSESSAHFLALYETRGRLVAPPPSEPHINQLATVQAVLEAAGVVVSEENGNRPGIRLRNTQNGG